jgi:cyanophycin synthetase
MLDIRDLRALDGPNMYDYVPVTLLRYSGPPAAADEFAARLLALADQCGIGLEAPRRHGPSALGEWALTWRTSTPEALATLAEHLRDPAEYSLADALAELARERPAPALAAVLDQARQRDVPALLTDAGWRIGHGIKSQALAATAPDWPTVGRIPLVAITGTNGKTTTTRLIDHTLRLAGWRTGRTDTDGIWQNGILLDYGDWTGYGGAAAVLADPQVELAVLETARGGLLRRGLAFDRCNVAVVTNVTEDHLPDRGVATVAEMARAKATIVRVLDPGGQAVLNADDPTVVELVAPLAAAPIIWFSLSSVAPVIAAARAAAGTTLFVRDEELYISQAENERRLMAVSELPLALGGLARHNIANSLAAAGALHALGLSDGQIVLGLASFQPNVRDNPGRLNQFHRAGVTVVMDYAHNSDGLRVLLHSAVPLKAIDGRLWVIYSGTGDRTDAQISEQGTIIGSLADRFIIKRDPTFLRGRPEGQIEPLMRAAALAAGMAPEAIIELDGDAESLDFALGAARSGDVIAFTVHKERTTQIERLSKWEAHND